MQVVDATVDDHRSVHEFSDAELTAMLRRHVGVLPVESDQERPADGALNWDPMPCGPEALKAAGYERIFSEKVMSPSPRHTHQPTVLRPKGR